ncbi:MAG: YitT family protein, partial [Alistipes sp.]|nr:YitT family protein [Candidatus Minthomonas equi]
CEKIKPYQELIEPGQLTIMGDVWLDLLCFVLILSIAQAMLFNMNASTGGIDIVAKFMQVYGHMDIGTAVTVAGAVISCSALLIHPLKMVLIGFIGTWINGVAIDYFTASINRKKRVCIISSECDRIRSYIIYDLARGCSLYEVTGGYTGEKQMELQALLSKDEYAKVLKFVKENHIPSFITGSNVSEVYGLWLSHERKSRFFRRKRK